MHGPATILPLRFDGVSFAARGVTLIDDLTFELRSGQRTVILGPNGAGKSLTLRLCHGLIAPSSGRIVWAGLLPAGRKRHAMLFQRPVLLRRSAFANLTHALSVAGVERRARNACAREALARFGLEALAGRPARVLSGGEQQRLAMARAWALRPEVLFLDEPTASLDPAATAEIERMIAAFDAEGMKIVMTTHDLAQARRLADEILFLHRGRLLERGPAGEFFRAPRSREAAAFLGGALLW